jgi:spermidine dehydrogenase
VWGRACVLAGYNQVIPYLCPELPEAQKVGLADAVKSPIYYNSVLLRNWRAWKKLGIGCASAPGSYHSVAYLDYPVSLGEYRYSQSPDDPIIVHMERFPKGSDHQASVDDQSRAGRYEMYSTSFETIEREIRLQLSGMLAGGDFDAARDIEAITVNRWAHGYSKWYNDSDLEQFEEGEFPNVIGRKRFGRIVIANSDAGANSTIDAAIDQAHRAISELDS